MIMERKSQDRERKADEQEIDKLSVHQLSYLPNNVRRSKWGIHCIFSQSILYFKLQNNRDY
jgi:hypothetical protein